MLCARQYSQRPLAGFIKRRSGVVVGGHRETSMTNVRLTNRYKGKSYFQRPTLTQGLSGNLISKNSVTR